MRLKFTAYQELEYKNPAQGYTIACMLVAVDYDKETFLLRPFPGQTITNETGYEWAFSEDEFWVAAVYVHQKPKSKLKLIKR